MSSFDSRFLHLGDCYGHRFTHAGSIPYELSHLPLPPGAPSERDSALVIAVLEGSDESSEVRQHNVTVSESGGTLRARPARLEIALGDTVLWVADKTVETGFCVRATSGHGLDSASLTGNSLYTHAFQLPGRYLWRDAHGSGLRGEVLVTKPDADSSGDWLEALAKGTLVYVSDDEATPAAVEVFVGQTVFWAIAKADGVSITDVTLLHQPDASGR
jgi:plastocyanin